MSPEFTQLNQICQYLIAQPIALSKNQEDGRIDSIHNEQQIIEAIEKKFSINVPSTRHWADFHINDIPVNIKTTTTRTADNASSKEGLYYCLTGQVYNGSNDWETYLKLLSENTTPTSADYYFLVVNKEDATDIFFNSLKCIIKLVPNGNNLPFQIKWRDNKTPHYGRDFSVSQKILLSALGQSLKWRADAYSSFQRYFHTYC